jgi:hypothetical protein
VWNVDVFIRDLRMILFSSLVCNQGRKGDGGSVRAHAKPSNRSQQHDDDNNSKVTANQKVVGET